MTRPAGIFPTPTGSIRLTGPSELTARRDPQALRSGATDYPATHHSRYPVTPVNLCVLGPQRTAMQEEAEIMINGAKLTDAESMTVRVAIDTLANVLAAGLEEQEGRALTEVYLASLSRIQTLLESRKPRTQ